MASILHSQDLSKQVPWIPGLGAILFNPIFDQSRIGICNDLREEGLITSFLHQDATLHQNATMGQEKGDSEVLWFFHYILLQWYWGLGWKNKPRLSFGSELGHDNAKMIWGYCNCFVLEIQCLINQHGMSRNTVLLLDSVDLTVQWDKSKYTYEVMAQVKLGSLKKS